MPKLLFYITEDWTFCNHRLPLARAAIKAGFEVFLLTNVQSHGDVIRSAGIKLIPLAMKRRSINPIVELMILRNVISIYRSVQPDIVHHVAMKPVIYGSIAAMIVGIPRVVNALAGMGYLFISNSFKARVIRSVVKKLFRILLNINYSRLILQNPDDVLMLVENGVVEETRVCLVRGSGVAETIFVPTPEPPPPVTVILPARMLLDKGVMEFVDAATVLKNEGVAARFVLVGDRDPENPTAIPAHQLRHWQQEQTVEWWGHCSDMPAVLKQAHIVCLPSYREGLPKSLLEAASCGKPIIATDVPGCREIVRRGENGLLVPARNAHCLADALRTMISDRELRHMMGLRGRELVLKGFTEQQVVKEILAVYRELLST